MKARVEKKLSKRLVELMPKTYANAWQDDHSEPSELAHNQGSCVSGLMCVGGGVDYWGEGVDAYSVFEHFEMNFEWILNFDLCPVGHPQQFYPNTEGFRNTTINKFKRIKRLGLV